MDSILKTIAAKLAESGAPAIGGLIGTAIGGPAGTAIGGIAGKALETLAKSLGTDPEPEAIAEALNAPDAVQKVQGLDEKVPDIVAIYTAEIERAAKNDQVEAEKGFGAWAMRRTVTTYAVLLMLVVSFFCTVAGAVGLLVVETATMMSLVGHAVAIFMAWNGLVSGGRAVTDAVKAYKVSR